MRVRRAITCALMLCATSGLASACANPEYDDASARARLEESGLGTEQASCVTRAMERQIGTRRLGAHEMPTETENAKFVAILDECGVDVTTDEAGSS